MAGDWFRYTDSLRSKRFRGVWEQRKTEERDFRCFCRAKNGARAKKRKSGVALAPFFARVTPTPRKRLVFRSLQNDQEPYNLLFGTTSPARWTESRAVIGYPSRLDKSCLARSGYGFVPQRKFIMFWCFIPYNKSFIDQACSIKMAGYWPRSFFACLWTSSSSQSLNTQKKNLPNIQPFWPHAWSISHISHVF